MRVRLFFRADRKAQRALFRLRVARVFPIFHITSPLCPKKPKPPKKPASSAAKGQICLHRGRRQSRRRRQDEASPRRQGREPRRDDPHRSAGASRLHDHHGGLHVFLRQQAHLSRRARRRQVEAGVAQHGERSWATNSATREGFPLLVAVRSGAPRLHARHDGYDPQPRPQRRDRPRPRRAPRRTSVSPGTATAASSRCTATSSWACRRKPTKITSPSKSSSTSSNTRRITRTSSTASSPPKDQQELVTRFKKLVKDRTGTGFPNDPVGAAQGRRRRRLRFLDERPRDRLSPQIQHPRRMGHGGQRAGHGLWQHRRDQSGSGVAFTRNPANGEKEFYGEFLINAQGEDVVAGVRTPSPSSELKKAHAQGLRRAR